MDEIVAENRINMDKYASYIRSKGRGKQIFMDITTARFTCQKMMNLALNESTLFFYWTIYIEPGDYKVFTVAKPGEPYSHSIFKEFLCTSVEPPIGNLEGGLPLYKTGITKTEHLRIGYYKSILKGE